MNLNLFSVEHSIWRILGDIAFSAWESDVLKMSHYKILLDYLKYKAIKPQKAHLENHVFLIDTNSV